MGQESIISTGPGYVGGDTRLKHLAHDLGLRTVLGVGGGRYRIEGEELILLMELARRTVEIEALEANEPILRSCNLLGRCLLVEKARGESDSESRAAEESESGAEIGGADAEES